VTADRISQVILEAAGCLSKEKEYWLETLAEFEVGCDAISETLGRFSRTRVSLGNSGGMGAGCP
jgi:hypothetical protein